MSRKTFSIGILIGILFSNSHAGVFSTEEILVKNWGAEFKKDLSASGEIKENYFSCKRRLENESLREAIAEETYEWTIKIAERVEVRPEQYGKYSYLNDLFSYRYDYSTVGGIDVYGGSNPLQFAFMNKGVLLMYSELNRERKPSYSYFDCDLVDSFLGKSKAKLLFL